jgi:lysozyme
VNTLGPAGTKLIQSFEGYLDRAYLDQKGIPTIGWGHTGPDVHLGDTCTEYQAAQWFTHDTQSAVNAVNKAVDAALNQNQFDALCSLCFNIGQGNFAGSTLVKVLNSGNYMMAAEQILVWNHVNGVPNAGLTRRREAERALFLST